MEKNHYNKEGKQEGYWEYYYDNGKLESKGKYINGKKEGYWEWYHSNGELYLINYFVI